MIRLAFGDVREKRIVTPNHFVSHMVEHIAWRLGASIELHWEGTDWNALGEAFGKEIVALGTPHTSVGFALGMIDDGSARVKVELGDSSMSVTTKGGVDLEWFLQLRCEQLTRGGELLDLIRGLTLGLRASIKIEIWSLEDPHHTWEGIFRGIGIALSKIFAPRSVLPAHVHESIEVAPGTSVPPSGNVTVIEGSLTRSTVWRGTAETGICVTIDFEGTEPSVFRFDVDESIREQINEADALLRIFSEALGARITIDFKATLLSSSHVVFEDVGMVIGRSLLEILKLRMEQWGVNGAGSSLEAQGVAPSAVVGISVEGRKFWKFVPLDGDTPLLCRSLLIGQTVLTALRSEDLDDFVDGLAGGLLASLMIHVEDYSSPSETWSDVFRGLGASLHEAFEYNPFRKGVPPGVKATLT